MTNRRVGGTGVATGSCVSLSLRWCGVRESTGCTGLDRRHTTSCTPHVLRGNESPVVAPIRAQRIPSRFCAIPRVIAENASPKLNPVAPTTRGRVHSPEVKKPHVKSVTRKENAGLLPPGIKQRQNGSSRVDELMFTQNVSQQRW